jgi:hypothetical protein
MKLIPVKVESHSEYKAPEYPIRFYWANIKFEIKEIGDRWYQVQSTPDWPVADYFKVRTFENKEYILKHELKNDLWFLVSPDETFINFSPN